MKSFSLLSPILLLLLSSGASAAIDSSGRFFDDFESGTELLSEVPPGKWDRRANNDASVTLDSSTSAAHRGLRGLRLDDNQSSTAAAQRVDLEVDNLGQSSASVRFRSWIRFQNTTTPNADYFLFATMMNSSNSFILEMGFYPNSNRLYLAGRDRNAAYTFEIATPALSSGTWYLVESVLLGIGTANGTRRLYINGVLEAQRTGIDLTGVSVARLRVGQVFAQRGDFVGRVDFDDLRTSWVPQASRIELNLLPAAVGACTPVTASVLGSEDSTALTTPISETVSLNSNGTVRLFTTSACSGAGTLSSTLTIAPGATTSNTVYAKTTGTVPPPALTATPTDLIPRTQVFSTTVLSQGSACSSDLSCASGVCANGYCCNVACDGVCGVCAAALGASANGVCSIRSSSTTCRPAVDVCDAAETCNGSSGVCPADGMRAAGSVCRAGGVCTDDATCDGSTVACPANAASPSTRVCRASGGDCDVAENCTGSSPNCPANVFRAAGDTCRNAAGRCDAVERCTGASALCPADGKLPSGEICNPSAGTCDVPERCSGVDNACPADVVSAAGTVCREVQNSCDVEEVCGGADGQCPADQTLTVAECNERFPHHLRLTPEPAKADAGSVVTLIGRIETGTNALFALATPIRWTPAFLPDDCEWQESGPAAASDANGEFRSSLSCTSPRRISVCVEADALERGCAEVVFRSPPGSVSIQLERNENVADMGETLELRASVTNISARAVQTRLVIDSPRLRLLSASLDSEALALDGGAVPLGVLEPGEARSLRLSMRVLPGPGDVTLTARVLDPAEEEIGVSALPPLDVRPLVVPFGCTASTGPFGVLALLALVVRRSTRR